MTQIIIRPMQKFLGSFLAQNVENFHYHQVASRNFPDFLNIRPNLSLILVGYFDCIQYSDRSEIEGRSEMRYY